jgi:hypothetical protein
MICHRRFKIPSEFIFEDPEKKLKNYFLFMLWNLVDADPTRFVQDKESGDLEVKCPYIRNSHF